MTVESLHAELSLIIHPQIREEIKNNINKVFI